MEHPAPRFSGFECKICLRVYSEVDVGRLPVILPQCGHTICRGCVQQMWQRNGRLHVDCPFDRIPLIMTNLNQLKRNFTVLEIMREFEEEERRAGRPVPDPIDAPANLLVPEVVAPAPLLVGDLVALLPPMLALHPILDAPARQPVDSDEDEDPLTEDYDSDIGDPIGNTDNELDDELANVSDISDGLEATDNEEEGDDEIANDSGDETDNGQQGALSDNELPDDDVIDDILNGDLSDDSDGEIEIDDDVSDDNDSVFDPFGDVSDNELDDDLNDID